MNLYRSGLARKLKNKYFLKIIKFIFEIILVKLALNLF
jgi:hypothetical protein